MSNNDAKIKIIDHLKNEFKSKSPIKIPTEEITSILEDLYINRKLSQTRIAKIFSVQGETICRWLKRCKIPLRDRYDSVSISLSKYEIKPFSNDLSEKSYLIGLRYGDLTAQSHGRRIRISVSSSHPAMFKLFKGLFEKYGQVKLYPRRSRKKIYLWSVYSNLDKTFSFLSNKENGIPKWILKDDNLFFAFLSGYFDAEGCISISQNHGSSINWIIKSTDKKILEDIANKLKEMGFSFQNPKLAKKANYSENDNNYQKNEGFSYKKDYWYIRNGIKTEVIRLLRRMNLRHEEKVMKHKLCKKLIHTDWKDGNDQIIELRNKIKNDVKECTEEAKIRFNREKSSRTHVTNIAVKSL